MIIYVVLKESKEFMKEGMNMKNKNYIGVFIKSERNKKGLSVRKLAELSGVSPTTISDLENGNTKKHAFETMVKISKVLDIDMNNFVENVNTFYMDVSKDYIVSIKRIDENCVEFSSNDEGVLLKLLKSFDYNVDEIELDEGDILKVNIKSILSDDEEENYLFCPYCNSELG